MGKSRAALAFAAAIWAGGSACAMKPQPTNAVECRLVGGEKLPAELGGADAVCAAIRAAVASAPGTAITLEVVTPYIMAARATTADGRQLAEQRVASSDRTLNAGSVQLLGRALADQLTKTP